MKMVSLFVCLIYSGESDCLPVPSGAPTGLVARKYDDLLVLLIWSQPEPAQHNGIIRHYLITLLYSSGLSSTLSVRTFSSATNYTLTGLLPYTHYRISVAAVTIGPGPSSDSIDIITDEIRKYCKVLFQ